MGEIGQIPNHQVKVDNWPLFFLQRLHHFYRKKSHCDLTLLFSTLDTIKSVKVHKLVLHACTDYFESMDVKKDSEHGEFLQLSNEMHPDVVIPIISFMYTGKLEFPVTLQPRLYEAAAKLRMTILTKLLDVQPNKNQKSDKQGPDAPLSEVSMFENDEPILITSNATENNQDGQNLNSSSTDAVQSSNFSSPCSSKQVEEPVVTLIPASMVASKQKQNLKPDVSFVQLSDIGPANISNQVKVNIAKDKSGQSTYTSKSKIVGVSLPPTLPGRKLPVWKRKVPFTGSQTIAEKTSGVRTTMSYEFGKPTRFEWDEDLNDPTYLRPVEDALRTLSHDGVTKISQPIILEGDPIGPTHSNDADASDESLKRSFDGSNSESPPHKRSRSDLQDMKEYGKQQQLRNEIICSEENADDIMDTDDLYGTCDDDIDELSSFSHSNVNSSTPKPILKTVSKPEPPVASKRVRFSLEGKENNQQQRNDSDGDFTTAKQPESVLSRQKIVLPMNVNQIQSGKHHVKIVSEVLKKYPNLAKRENIKLRVVSKNPAAVPPAVQQAVEGDAGGGNKSSSSSVSYIFLTNKGSADLFPESGEKQKLFDAENKTGPWLCQVCNSRNPIEFDSYYTYRRHLVEVHSLKIDARICEYCGVKNNKRNHLLYHLYTKHGIEPPPHVSFPKCPECNYIALSEALLVKHKITHDTKSMTCYTCNAVFKSASSMQIHCHSDWHRNKLKEVRAVIPDYPCPFCDARFGSGGELRDHIETGHHSQNLAQKEGKQIYRCPYCERLFGDGDQLGKHIMSVHWGKDNQVSDQRSNQVEVCDQSGQQLQYREETETSCESDVNPVENQQSSELESLSNVASGIATSLNLESEQTVVYYEQRTEGQDIGGEATVVSGDECNDYIIPCSMGEIENKQCGAEDDDIETINIEDDSDSRTSNTEEVVPTSCSDHDYSEPQSEETLRQVLPVHTVENQLTETPVIQQILPEHGLVFSNTGNVVFQSSCVTDLPQRVILASGKVVLPQISHTDQNLILSQVIPQTRIILSSPILQQSGSIIEDGGSTIVFTNAEETDQVDHIQAATIQYPMEESESTEVIEKQPEENVIHEEESQEAGEKADNTNESSEPQSVTPEEPPDQKPDQEQDQDSVQEVGVDEGDTSEEITQVTEKVVEEDEVEVSSEPDAKPDNSKVVSRVETAKIVDDWDETNESQQSVECRSDGPSRPEFF